MQDQQGQVFPETTDHELGVSFTEHLTETQRLERVLEFFATSGA